MTHYLRGWARNTSAGKKLRQEYPAQWLGANEYPKL
jgi:hypothetical protein